MQNHHLNRRRVLLVAPQPFFANRGTPFNVRALAQAISEAGYSVDLLVFPLGREIEIPGVTIIRSPSFPFVSNVPIGPSWSKLLLDVGLSLKAAWLVFRNNYKVLHGIEEGGMVVALLGRLIKTPYVYDMDSCMPDQLEASGFLRTKFLLAGVRKLEFWCVRGSAAVLTVCEYLSDKARAIFPAAPIWQIEDFPLDENSKEASVSASSILERHDLQENRVILYTGNFERYQGIELLLEGFQKATASGLKEGEWKLLLVGGGEKTHPRRVFVERLVASLGIEQSVILAGQRPAYEMQAYMEAADLLASPRIEGGNTPLKLYSYMSAGVPILATDINSHTQVLSEETAFLAGVTEAEFAQGILRAATATESELCAKAASAKQLVETRYSQKRFFEQVEALYQTIAPLEAPAQVKESAAA